MTESVNKQLQQMMITHAVYLEKYKTFEENKMLKILEAADEELKALLELKYKPGLTRSRQEQLYDAIRSLEAGYATVFDEEMRSDLKAFADREGGWTVEQLRKVTNPYVEIEFIAPSAAQIYAAAESSFLIMQDGVTLDLESIISSVFKGREAIIEQSLRQGYILGKTNQQMVSELMGSGAAEFFDGNIRKARTSMERVVRTSFSHMSGVARDEVYSRNDDLVKGYKWVETLDSRTSARCIELGGKVWYYDKDNIPNGASLLPGPIKPPAHFHCFDKETDVYTNKGWLSFSELTGDEMFFSINPETLEPNFVKAVKHIKYRYKGEMIHFYNKCFDSMVTPGHQMFYKNRRTIDRKFKFIEAEKLPKWTITMYRGVEWKGDKSIKTAKLGNYDIDIELYCRFMGYYLSEGSVTKIKGVNSYRVKISQETYLDKFYDDLKNLPFNVTKTKEAVNIYDYSVSKDLVKYGKCSVKYVPDIIKQLPPVLIKVFLESFILGDGVTMKPNNWKGGNFSEFKHMTTTSKRLCDDLGELIFKAGGHPSFALKNTKGKSQTFKNGTYTINHDLWYIAWCKNINIDVERLKRKRVEYDDMVYCVELEKWHTLMTRRNGKVGWSGNCRSTTVPILKSWRELGINISEAPEGTRSALDGYVPASTTYADWFDKAGADVQKEVLGAERFKMYQAGEMKVTQFMKNGSWLSLEQLKQRGH